MPKKEGNYQTKKKSNKLNRKIGKELGNDTETSEEEIELEIQSSDEIHAASKAANEYKTKIFALETEVEKKSSNTQQIETKLLERDSQISN